MSHLRKALTLVVVLLATAAFGLPLSGAAFTDAASNDGNEFRARSPVRATTYQLTPSSGFSGTTFTLNLEQPLADDYFVILRGAAGDNSGGGNVGPNSTYARVTGDPHGNFGDVTGAAQLRLSRIGTENTWQGQVTVVESIDSQTTAGFTLVDVAEVFFDDPNDAAGGAYGPDFASAPVAPWSDLGRVAVYAGSHGGGVTTQADDPGDHITAWGLAVATPSITVDVYRFAANTSAGGYLNGDTTFTAYVVEWGSEWTIQTAQILGSAGGNGVNSPGEWDTTFISPVPRANTFVVASGRSIENGLGDGWEGTIWTLGDGVNQNAVENRVALAQEYTETRQAWFYIHTHPRLAVDYRFGADGSIGTNELSGTQSVDGLLAPETRSGSTSAGYRLPIISNTSNGTGNAYPRPIVWVRHTGDGQVTWTRSRSGQPGAYWIQSVDFGELWR